MKNNIKKALLFALVLLPIAAVAGFFSIRFQMETMPELVAAQAEQFGGEQALVAVYVVQILIYAAVFGFLGYLLAAKTGLLKSFRIEKKPLLVTLAVSLAGGALFSLEHWTFGAVMPELRQGRELLLSVNNWLASVIYGGVIEELMLRWFFMSLLSFIIWKVFARKSEKAPTAVIVIGNVNAALLFAAGHLPATIAMFGQLTPMLLVRCLLLNGAAGVIFGEIYRRYGIQYAMVCHALFHIVRMTIWLLFI